MFGEIVIGGGEMSATIKTTVYREWRRMRGLEYQMLTSVDELPFSLGV